MPEETQYSVRFDTEKHLVVATMTGAILAPHAAAMLRDAVSVAREQACTALLMDLTGGHAGVSMGTIYDYMSRLHEFGLEEGDRLAVVYQAEDDQHRFAELVAHNRGWRNLRYFDDYAEAETWVLNTGA